MVEKVVRVIVGLFVLLSTYLAYHISHYWILIAVFMAANLVQSAFTDWCPLLSVLLRLGAERDVPHNVHERILRGIMGGFILLASLMAIVPSSSKTGFVSLTTLGVLLIFWRFKKAKVISG